MVAVVYDNMGVLGREKTHVYTVAPVEGAVSEAFYVILPAPLRPYETQSGEIAINPPDAFGPLLLRECLATARDGMPVLRWLDRDGKQRDYTPGTYGM